MIRPNFQNIAEYSRTIFGECKGDALLSTEWIKSAIDTWAHTASIKSFSPYDADFALDRSFDELLIEFFEALIEDRSFDNISTTILICSSLEDALNKLMDENQHWEEGKDKSNDVDMENAGHLSAATLTVFGVLQRFESERAMRWAAAALRENSIAKGFLSWTTQPFPIRLYESMDQKSAHTEARSAFFISLYEWAERNTTNDQVFSLFPDFLLHRLEAIHGSNIDNQQFDVLEHLFASKDVRQLTPIEVLDGSLDIEAKMYDDENVFSEFAERLSDLTSVHVARLIRELDVTTKKTWLESDTLRLAFKKPLNTPPVPVTEPTLEESEAHKKEGILAVIHRRASDV